MPPGPRSVTGTRKLGSARICSVPVPAVLPTVRPERPGWIRANSAGVRSSLPGVSTPPSATPTLVVSGLMVREPVPETLPARSTSSAVRMALPEPVLRVDPRLRVVWVDATSVLPEIATGEAVVKDRTVRFEEMLTAAPLTVRSESARPAPSEMETAP
jgi:hypothetical protein